MTLRKKRKLETKNWYVLYVKPRNEFKVSERLAALGFITYVPFRTEVRQWSDRKKKIKVALLPSIVLIKLALHQINDVFTVPNTVRFLFEQGKRAVVQDHEVKAMQDYLEGKFAGEQKQLAVGDEVLVPSLNEEAQIIKIKGDTCFARLQKLSATVSFQLH